MDAKKLRQGVQNMESPTGSAVDARDSAHNNVVARPLKSHNSDTNSTAKQTSSHKPFGPLGARGHGG